jgi:hypothetical protein
VEKITSFPYSSILRSLEDIVSTLEGKEDFEIEDLFLIFHLQQMLNEIRPGLRGNGATSLRIRLSALGSPESRHRRLFEDDESKPSEARL